MTALTVAVPARSRRYRVHVAPGALERVGELCEAHVPAHRYAVIADDTVAGLYGRQAVEALVETGVRARIFPFAEGERSKSRAEWARLTDELLAAGYGRDSAVVALGGGVTGDLAGFVAATYMRGVPVVQVPTTLLAMVDASVGGKTAVNTAAGKNLVGAFHHPSLVVADPTLLATLSGEERSAGLAEAVKTAALADRELFGWMEGRMDRLVAGEPDPLARLVARVVAIKAEIVGEDPEESGLREVLNFGHTVGHALEAVADYGLTHGRAVAAGMRVEAHLGEGLGITRAGTAEELTALLAAAGHERRIEGRHSAPELLSAMETDKKSRREHVRVVLLERIGRVARDEGGAYTHPLPPDRAEGALAEALAAAGSAAAAPE